MWLYISPSTSPMDIRLFLLFTLWEDDIVWNSTNHLLNIYYNVKHYTVL